MSPERSASLCERSESKDPNRVYVLIAVKSFLSVFFVRKPESAFRLHTFSGSFDLHSSRKPLSCFAQDDRDEVVGNASPSPIERGKSQSLAIASDQ